MAKESYLRAWGRGWRVWRPPPALRTEYLITWAIGLLALVFAAPFVAELPPWGRVISAVGVVLLLTMINAAFQRHGS